MPVTPAEIARRALTDHLAALPAGQLLTRYAASRDPQAFAGLVQQFGPLVLGTCRRVLGPSPDADDAFQAVFLALARQAGSFRDAEALPAWLHRVSLRVSRKALARRDPVAPLPEAVADPADPFADVAWKDVRRVLDEEIDVLPEKYRGPVVLCWLDGLTQDEAAGKLGLSLNTLKRRLDAGRELLRSRLLRRGLAPVLVTAVVATPTGLQAVVPESLKALAVELGVGGEVPTGVHALEAVLPAAGPTRRAVLAALVGGAAATGVVVWSQRSPRVWPGPSRPAVEGSGLVAPEVVSKPQPFTGPRQRIVPKYRLESLAWSPDGKTLAGKAGGVTLWDVGTGTELGVIPTGGRVIAFSPDFKTLASGHADPKFMPNMVPRGDGEIRLWDVATREQKAVLRGHRGDTAALDWSPDGKTLASGGYDSTARLWDVTTGEEKLTLGREWLHLQFPMPLQLVKFSPDGATLATVPRYGDRIWPKGVTGDAVKLWDVTTGRERGTFGVRRNATDGEYLMLTAAWGPYGDTLAVAGPNLLWVLDVTTGKGERIQWGPFALTELGSSWVVPRLGPGGKSVAWGYLAKEGRLRVSDVKTGDLLAMFQDPCEVTDVAFRPDGKALAWCGPVTGSGPDPKGTITIWDVSRAK